MKKLTIIFTIILILLSFFSVIAKGGLKIWPGKLTITMNEWYDKWIETKYNKIQVTNPYLYGINVSTKLDHPSAEVISEGYSYIPDLSWIKIEPEIIYLPPNSSSTFEVIIQVPKDEQSKHFNERWETWAVFDTDLYSETQGAMNFKIQIAVKLFINTPKSEATISQYLPIVFFLFFSFFMVFFILFYKKKRKNYQINDKKINSSMYFFKRKKF